MSVQQTVRRVCARELVGLLASQSGLRRTAISLLERNAYRMIVGQNRHNRPQRVVEEIFCYFRALLHSMDRAVERGHMSKHTVKRMAEVFMGNVMLRGTDDPDVLKTAGVRTPKFLLVSPTGRCNLHCKGCYAESDSTCLASLDATTFDRILNEKLTLWGSHFTVVSGGEPLLWRDGGIDLIDMAMRHENEFFMFYTNGTLIDREVAGRMAEAGNITPAISIEGFREETDARRGAGIHDKILRAFDALREQGVPFGISATATRDNWEVITSDEFVDFYFDEQGAIYGWLFQYMPIGRGQSIDAMVAPEDRVEMLRRIRRHVYERDIFFADFWNNGPISCGCISAGRPGGYFHIDWNGEITPCAFVPYSTDNIHTIYSRGGDLNEALKSPLFQRIRKWQDEYGFAQPSRAVDNWLCPCVIRDHFEVLKEAVLKSGAEPVNREAAIAVSDSGYCERLACYGREIKRLMDPIWARDFADL
ncbi:MAG: radical SAM protein [Candidatus Eisenbacteria bacterium]|nr:radical SAM protein [Candidatus Eisenbacteria bacterium]